MKIDDYKDLLPQHVAIIMDGNGRWAKQNKLKIALGHKNGVLTVRNIIRETERLGIKCLSLFAFSTENWKRSDIEVNALMKLISEFFHNDILELHEKNIKVVIIGDVYGMPVEQRDLLISGMELTKNNTGMILNVALNYGSKAEITSAIKQIAIDYKNSAIDIDDINEDTVNNYLYTKDCPDVDLVIRTSGEQRLSNFLLYQCAYSEFVFPKVLWPDFSIEEYHKTLFEFLSRDRRFGARLNE